MSGERVIECFYVASRASIPARSAMWRHLRDHGVKITSTWIDEAGEGETACNTDLWRHISREVTDADALILYAEDGDFPLKGALIEVGMALAQGKRVLVVAPDVKLEPHTLRPLGSWAAHPMVTLHQTVQHAISHAHAASSAGDRS